MRREAQGVRRQGYRDLKVWEKAMVLVGEVYGLSAKFPPGERFGLTTKIRRAGVSIPSNIAEDYARGGGNYSGSINSARGSLAELETQLELAARLGFAATTDVDLSSTLLPRLAECSTASASP